MSGIELAAAYVALLPETSKIAPGLTETLGALKPKVTPDVDGAGAGSKFESGFMPALKKVGAAAGAALAVAGVTSFAKDSIAAFEGTTKAAMGLQRVIGGSVEDASRLNFAARMTGVSQDKLSTSLKLLEKNITSVGGSTPAGAKALAELGISATDATGKTRPMSELLPDIAAKFKDMPNGAEKSALAMKLFGRSGLDMVPMLNKGKEGLAELMEQSDKFGLTVGDKQAADIKKSVAAQREWQAALDGVKVQIGANLLPLMTDFAGVFRDRIIPALVSASGFVKEHGAEIMGIAKAVVPVVAALGTLVVAGKGISAVKGAASEVSSAISGIKNAASAVKSGLSSLAGEGGKLASLGSSARSAATAVAGMGKAAATAAIDAGRAAAQYVAHLARMGAAAIAEAAKSAAAWVASSARTLAALAAQGAGFVASRVAMLAGAAATGIVTAAQWALNLALNANPIGLIVLAIAALVGGLILAYRNSETFRNIVNAAWSAIKTAVSAVISWLTTAIPAAFQWVKDAFLTYTPLGIIISHWDQIKAGVGAAVEWLKSAVSAAWQFIRDAFLNYTPLGIIISHWDQIKAFIAGAVDNIKAVIAWFGGLPGMFSGWFGSARDAASSMLGEMVSYVSGIPGQVLAALGNLGSLLYNAGRELIQGLINGITAMIGSVGSAMGGIADKIRGFLPGSPVKEGPLTSWNNGGAGKRLGGLLVAGLDASRADVNAAMNRLVQAPSLSLSAHTAVTGSGLAGRDAAANGDFAAALVSALSGAELVLSGADVFSDSLMGRLELTAARGVS